MPGLVDGFNKANDTLAFMDDKLSQMVKDGGSAAQSLLAIKGFTETMAASRAGSAVGQGASGIASSLADAYLAGKALRAAASGLADAGAAITGSAGALSAVLGASTTLLAAGGAYAASQTVAYKNAGTRDRVMAATDTSTTVRLGVQNAGAALTGAVHGKDKAGWSGFFAGAWNGLFGNNNSDGMPSYAVGSYDLPKDQVAQVHKGEMILPASIAEAVRKSISGTSGSSAPIHVEIKVMLQSGSDADVKRVGAQIKSIIQNPSMAKSMKES
jgi:hypothetical protein